MVTKMSQICIFNSKTVVARFTHELFIFDTCVHSRSFHEMTCFAVISTTSARDKFSIFSCYLLTTDTNLIPGYLEYILQAYIMTWND